MSSSSLKNFRIFAHKHLIRFGIDLRKKRKDRIVLETIVFPELLRNPQYKSILFVGCAWYTLHYPKIFRNKRFITIEINPEEACYGAPEHFVDSCEELDKHFAPNSIDAIILNGVYGFGLNHLPAIEKTLRQIHQCLVNQGLFVFGWNDLPTTAPYAIEQLTGLNAFEPYVFPKLQSAVYESDPKNRHRFQFYKKGN